MSRIPATSKEVGAPETERTEIEVTPEMIEAGRAILYSYDDRFSNENDVVEGIYRAMVAKLRP